MIKLLLLAALLFSPWAHALTTSEHALRIEDTKGGNVVLGAEAAKLERGELYHSVVLLWGNLDIYGEVDDVVVLSGHVTFHEGAKLSKSLLVMGGTFESLPGAQVASENVVAKIPGPLWRLLRSAGIFWRDNIDWVARFFAGMVSCIFLWLFGWAVFQLLPKLQANTAAVLSEKWLQNLLLGMFGSIGACVIFGTLLVSIIGWVLIPFYFLLLGFAALLSYLAAALWTGHRLLPPKRGKRINPLGFLLGFFVFQLFWTIPVWWAPLPVLLLWALGWGTLVRSVRLLWK